MPLRAAVDALTGRLIHVRFESTITSVGMYEPTPESTECLISPGWIDLQINGMDGVDFGNPDLTVDDIRRVTHRLYSIGVCHFLPTLITADLDRMKRALAILAEAAEARDLRHSIIGIHLEGPYISREDGPRGAHPLSACREPDWDEFQSLQSAADGRIQMITLAPELPGAIEFIRLATENGVRVAIGHTDAKRDEILRAIEAGARLSTHLGNGAHDMIQRHRNCIFDQLGEDRLFASIIADRHHLPPHLVKIFHRVKGTERLILVSDAVQYAGMPPGIYDAGYRQFEVREDGFIGVAGEPRLAGSGLLLPDGIRNVMRWTDASLADAIQMVTSNPARLLGVSHIIGRLAPGAQASFVLFDRGRDGRIRVIETVVAGETRYSSILEDAPLH